MRHAGSRSRRSWRISGSHYFGTDAARGNARFSRPRANSCGRPLPSAGYRTPRTAMFIENDFWCFYRLIS